MVPLLLLDPLLRLLNYRPTGRRVARVVAIAVVFAKHFVHH